MEWCIDKKTVDREQFGLLYLQFIRAVPTRFFLDTKNIAMFSAIGGKKSYAADVIMADISNDLDPRDVIFGETQLYQCLERHECEAEGRLLTRVTKIQNCLHTIQMGFTNMPDVRLPRKYRLMNEDEAVHMHLMSEFSYQSSAASNMKLPGFIFASNWTIRPEYGGLAEFGIFCTEDGHATHNFEIISEDLKADPLFRKRWEQFTQDDQSANDFATARAYLAPA